MSSLVRSKVWHLDYPRILLVIAPYGEEEFCNPHQLRYESLFSYVLGFLAIDN